MRMIKEYIVPFLLLVIFSAVMLSTKVLMQPFGNDDDVYQFVEIVELNIENENWDAAYVEYEKLEVAWYQVLNRIQYVLDKDYVLGFENNLSLLRGTIVAKGKQDGIIYCETLKDNWDSLSK